MSTKLSEEEKLNRQLTRDDKLTDKQNKLTDRHYEILQILRDAPNHPEVKYNSKYFENYFKVANITILRAISDLKEMDLIEEKQVHGSYVIKKEIGEIYSKDTIQNLALVASVKGLLQQYKNTPLYDSVAKLIYFLEPKVAKGDSLFSESRIVVPPQMEFSVNPRTWEVIWQAIQTNHKITFRYNKPCSTEDYQRKVWPYQLLLDDGSVYLFAYNEKHDAELLYSLNRMVSVNLSPETFELPENFDFNTRCGGGRLGAFTNGNVEKFKIRFTGYAKYWIKDHKWADDQFLEEDEDSCTITFSSSQFDKIYGLVLGWGIQATPLEPERLVKKWKKEIKDLYEKIKD